MVIYEFDEYLPDSEDFNNEFDANGNPKKLSPESIRLKPEEIFDLSDINADRILRKIETDKTLDEEFDYLETAISLRKQPKKINTVSKAYIAFFDGAVDQESFKEREIHNIDDFFDEICDLEDIDIATKHIFESVGGYIQFKDFEYLLSEYIRHHEMEYGVQKSLINELSRHYAALKTAAIFKNAGHDTASWENMQMIYESISLSQARKIQESLNHREKISSRKTIQPIRKYQKGKHSIIDMLLSMSVTQISIIYFVASKMIKDNINSLFTGQKKKIALISDTTTSDHSRDKYISIEEVIKKHEETHPYLDLSTEKFLEEHLFYDSESKNAVNSYLIWKEAKKGRTLTEISELIGLKRDKISSLKNKTGIKTTTRFKIPFFEIDYSSNEFKEYNNLINERFYEEPRFFSALLRIRKEESEGKNLEEISKRLKMSKNLITNLKTEEERYINKSNPSRILNEKDRTNYEPKGDNSTMNNSLGDICNAYYPESEIKPIKDIYPTIMMDSKILSDMLNTSESRIIEFMYKQGTTAFIKEDKRSLLFTRARMDSLCKTFGNKEISAFEEELNKRMSIEYSKE